MKVEYVCSKISSVRWLHDDSLKRSKQEAERFWICGTYNSPRNSLSVWTNLADTAEEQDVWGIYKVKGIDYPLASGVCNIVNYERRSVLASLENGDILLLRYSLDSGLELICKFDGNEELANHETTGLIVNDSKETISCGLDGKLYFLDLNSSKVTKTHSLTSNSLHCLDKISPNEVICGTTSGHVKVFDKRSQSVVLSLANELAIITAVQRNSHIPHIVAGANDYGLLYIWDLRSGQKAMAPASAHTAAINGIRYAENEPNLLFTSSYDGQLNKWNISNDFEINSVDAIIDKSNSYAINCFDINAHNELVCADDNEVLYVTTF